MAMCTPQTPSKAMSAPKGSMSTTDQTERMASGARQKSPPNDSMKTAPAQALRESSRGSSGT